MIQLFTTQDFRRKYFHQNSNKSLNVSQSVIHINNDERFVSMNIVKDGCKCFLQLNFGGENKRWWTVTNIEVTDDGFMQSSCLVDKQRDENCLIFKTTSNNSTNNSMTAYTKFGNMHFAVVPTRQLHESVKDPHAIDHVSCAGAFNEVVTATNDSMDLFAIATGDNKYGFREYQREKPEKYYLIIYQYEPELKLICRTFLNTAYADERIVKIFFNAQNDALLVCTSNGSFGWFQIESETFSQVYIWRGYIRYRFYFNHWKFGDTIVVIGENDEMFFLYMNGNEFCKPLRHHINSFEKPATYYELFTDKLGRSSLIRCTQSTIDIYDFLKGKLRVSINLPDRVECKHWRNNNEKFYSLCFGSLGNEIFLLQTINGQHTVYVYYVEYYEMTLLDFAKRIVFNTYPKDQLENLRLPRQLIPPAYL